MLINISKRCYGITLCVFIILYLIIISLSIYKNSPKQYYIGDYVQVNDIDKPLMIIGYCQKNISTGAVYDYIGVPVPDGYLGSDYNFVFNNDDVIKKINSDVKELRNYKTNLEYWYKTRDDTN